MAIPAQPRNPPPDPDLASRRYPWNFESREFDFLEDRQTWWQGVLVFGSVLCISALLAGLSDQPSATSAGLVLIVLGFLSAVVLTPLLYMLFQSGAVVGCFFAAMTLLGVGLVLSLGWVVDLNLALAVLAVFGLGAAIAGEARAWRLGRLLDSADAA